MIEVVYIGDKFYGDSGTMMSSIYKKEGKKYTRFDWGFLQIALANGENVKIRQANRKEMLHFKTMLADHILKKQK